MQLTAASVFLASLLASNAVAVPLTTRQSSSVEGQACTNGKFDGFCRADGRCGLQFPPNETSFQFISGQCGVADSTGGAFDDFFGRNRNDANDDAATDDSTDDSTNDDSVADDSDTDDEASDSQASVEGDACTNGKFDGFCRADGRCGLQFPPNETSFQFIRGQCGR
ncbi:hypothetical protein F4813DRAFT_359792 [Daldinia decipiens]|uniref:uncharacterized protein n=1 Tax=Daldinia decipiens TaxID=326647 RepID=UPI0020C429BE|nr:uncharacterized protein F4813DRAFT_359792 [Daldinia decipiens]KAI1657411.1 hypothetical protein F4813DRAFT_359792 [Daldinia decipiens]